MFHHKLKNNIYVTDSKPLGEIKLNSIGLQLNLVEEDNDEEGGLCATPFRDQRQLAGLDVAVGICPI